jgi:hypothetical protein
MTSTRSLFVRLLAWKLKFRLTPWVLLLYIVEIFTHTHHLHTAYACSPTVTPRGYQGQSLADRVNSVHVIVEGTIFATVTDPLTDNWPPIGNTQASVSVDRYFKSTGSDVIIINGFGQSSACLIEAHVGAHQIFFAVEDEQGNLWIHTLANVDTATIAEIETIVKQVPSTLLPTNSHKVFLTSSASSRLLGIVVLLVGTALIMGLLAVGVRLLHKL